LGEANVLRRTADLHLSLREWQEARLGYEQALNLYLVLRDLLGQANVYVDLGRVCFIHGDVERALEHEQKAMELFSTQRSEEWVMNALFYQVAMYTIMTLVNQGEQLEVLEREQVEGLLVACTTSDELFQCVTQHPFIVTSEGLQRVQEAISESEDEGVKGQLRALWPWLQRVQAEVDWYGIFSGDEDK
jgi:tetratricopeptide (TPR) repeat protein